jgi:hypothetical protein
VALGGLGQSDERKCKGIYENESIMSLYYYFKGFLLFLREF